MISEVNRHRIEKYLNAHKVEIEERALMSLTRKLIYKKPEEAQAILKAFILRHKGIETPALREPVEVENVEKEYHITPIPTVESKQKLYPFSSIETCSDTTSRHVTKREYVTEHIVGFSLSAFLVFSIIGGLINWLVF